MIQYKIHDIKYILNAQFTIYNADPPTGASLLDLVWDFVPGGPAPLCYNSPSENFCRRHRVQEIYSDAIFLSVVSQ